MTQPLPEIAVTDKTIPILESLGVCLDQMIETQMRAYPDTWSNADRREMAEQHLFATLSRSSENRNG